MITTRNINVNLNKGKLKLRHITTRDIDAGIRVEPPKAPIKTKSITTTTLADVADIAEKKRRDDIAAERTKPKKDEQGGYVKEPDKIIENLKIKCVSGIIEPDDKKIAMAEKKETIGEIKLPLEKVPQFIEPSKELIVTSIFPLELKETTKKKPWKEMTDEEKKLAIKERTAKMMATKAKKKKEVKK